MTKGTKLTLCLPKARMAFRILSQVQIFQFFFSVKQINVGTYLEQNGLPKWPTILQFHLQKKKKKTKQKKLPSLGCATLAERWGVIF